MGCFYKILTNGRHGAGTHAAAACRTILGDLSPNQGPPPEKRKDGAGRAQLSTPETGLQEAEQGDGYQEDCDKEVGAKTGYGEMHKGQTVQTHVGEDGAEGVQKEIGEHEQDGIDHERVKTCDQGKG
jgi:hypothetical protein